MATTHALVGFVVGAVAAGLGVPAPLAVGAAVAGSVLPDLDLYAGHRRTLHFPVLYPVGATLGVGTVAAGGDAAAAATVLFLVGAALHTTMDVFGGGLELRPWEGTSERAVYDHVRAQWIAPRRWVRYDGAPEDLALAGVLLVVAYPLHGPTARAAMFALLAVSAAYVVVRRRLAALAPLLAGKLPPTLRERLPGRYTA